MRITLFVAGFLVLFSAVARADCDVLETASQMQAEREVVISAILQLKSNKDIVKVIHGIEISSSPDAALMKFKSKARKLYPGYLIVSTLASPKSLLMNYSPCGADL